MTSQNMVVVSMTQETSFPEGCRISPLSNSTPWDNPEDIVSRATQRKFKEIVDVYVLTPLFFLSVPLNIINMIVFWKHGIKERINLCLFFLSLADIIVIAGHFELKLDRLYATISNTYYRLVVAKHSFRFMLHSLAGFIYVSGFMSTLIALERCFCVVSPLKAQGMLQTKTAGMIIAFGHLVIFGGHCFIATRWEVVCIYDPVTQIAEDGFYPSRFYFNNKQFVDALDGIVFGLLLPGIFVAGVSTTTMITIIKLRQMRQWRQEASSSTSSERSVVKDLALTRMLVGTNILFVSCTTPILLFHALLPFVPELSLSGKFYNTYFLMINVNQLCSYINSSFNFFVYYYFGTNFRTSVKQLFLLKNSRRK